MTALLINSCSKKEYLSNRNDTPETVRKFLTVPEGNPPVLQRISDAIATQENQYHFLDRIIQTNGMAVWNKVIVMPVNAAGDTLVMLPFADSAARAVKALLACRITRKGIEFMHIQAKDYELYGFGNEPHTFNATFVATQLMYHHYRIFGDTTFKVVDGRLFNHDNATHRLPRTFHPLIKSPAQRNARTTVSAVYECIGYVQTGCGELRRVAGDCRYETEDCKWVITIMETDATNGGGTGTTPGSTLPGGGGGSGGSGGGGSTVPSPWLDPHLPIGPQPPPVYMDPPVTPILPGSGGEFLLKDENGYYYERLNELEEALNADATLLLACPELQHVKQHGPFFQQLYEFQPMIQVINRVNSLHATYGTFAFQYLTQTHSLVANSDMFPIKITTMPEINKVTATNETLLEYFRLHINDFIQRPSIVNFSPYVHNGVDDTQLWNAPYENSIGALVHINMPLDGTVIESSYTSPSTATQHYQFTFTTMKTPLDGGHPVSGNRRFGTWSDGSGSSYFYIGGMDKYTTNAIALASGIKGLFSTTGYQDADKLWRGIIDNFAQFINDNKGVAAKQTDSVARINFELLEQYLKKEITLEQLKQELKC
ncbi:hypothetical protein GCM10011379_19360 [Filimonas zeae]|uniref:Uncharacterized protein n=1 Tax=Filimonas zeae TaxID=1737353 RepID=A0A917MV08_9BACT|nr:hypothetical protein GCM10011379_19360 [Filimonas zeae]